MRIDALYVESQACPLGVDVSQPALGWSYASDGSRAQKQSAYRIIVSESEENAQSGIGDVWDTGQIADRQQVHILYAGAELQSRTRYYWRVQVWDQDGSTAESSVAWWEMGLLHATDWSARWIGESEAPPSEPKALPIFRKPFELDKPVARARAYVCGLGQFELRLNGSKVSDTVLEPGWTNYNHTCLYCTYDVTDDLLEGDNTIGVMLGNGFYNVTGGRYKKFKGSFGTPRCLVQLEITYHDGSAATIHSSSDWLTTSGPVTFSCIYGGEDYDAGIEHDLTGWDQPLFMPSANWSRAVEVTAPSGKLKSQMQPPLKVQQIFQPINITQPTPGVFVADFGQNFSGWVQLTVRGSRGAQVTLSPAELLKDTGTANQKWTGSPYRFNYQLNGQGTESWSPRFTYYGFRYVQIEGAVPAAWSESYPDAPILQQIEGHMIAPDTRSSGSFVCSHDIINRTHAIINWAVLSNMKSIFTDCPHREKLGWLEQVHLMGPAIAYNTHIEQLLVKTMEDIRDAQLPNGMVPTTAPEYVVFAEPWSCFRDSVSWGGAYILIGWNLLQQYGNSRILTEHYAGMKAYIDYIAASSEQLIVHTGLGDWYDATDEVPGFAKNTPVSHTETAMFYHITDVFAQIAGLLGNNEDATAYGRLREEIRSAFNTAFFDPVTAQYATGSQTSNAMPLVLGLVEEAYKEQVLAHLIRDIEQHGDHTTAGDIGHRYVLLALAQNGRSDVIFRMACKTDYPSYGYQIVHGATTLTEAWDGPTVGKSQNHFMLGHIEEWFYSYVGGIQTQYDAQEHVYHVTVRPVFPDGLNEVEAEHRLPIGTIQVHWKRGDSGLLSLDVLLPPNCSGEIHIPADYEHSVTEKGLTLEAVQGIESIRPTSGWIILQVTSGSYQWVTTSHNTCNSLK